MFHYGSLTGNARQSKVVDGCQEVAVFERKQRVIAIGLFGDLRPAICRWIQAINIFLSGDNCRAFGMAHHLHRCFPAEIFREPALPFGIGGPFDQSLAEGCHPEMAAAVFDAGGGREAVVIGAVTEINFRNEAADGFAEKPELAVAAFEQRARPVGFVGSLPVESEDGAAIFDEKCPLRIGGPNSSQRIANDLRIERSGRELDGLRLIGMSGIVGTAGGQLTGEPEAARRIEGEVAAGGELEAAYGAVEADLQQVFWDFNEDLIRIRGHAAHIFGQYDLEVIIADAREALEVRYPERSVAGEGKEAGGSEGERRDFVVVESVEAV